VGQQLVQEQILVTEAAKLGISATMTTCASTSAPDPPAKVLFPNGKFIGDAAYTTSSTRA